MTDKTHNNDPEMRCRSAREAVLTRLDSEPDEVLRERVEKHLLSCQSCAELAEKTAALNERLRDDLNDDADVAPLWARINTALDTQAQSQSEVQSGVQMFMTGGRMMAFGTIAALLLVALFIFPAGPIKLDDNPPVTVTESINDFLTFKASGSKLDVKSSEPQELRRWFVKRLDFEVPLSSAMPAGFQLAGARLCSFLNRRLASFMYFMGDKVASLYIMAETGLDATLKRIPKPGKLSVFPSRGLTNVVWRNDGLLYVVVADFPESEALKFARSVSMITHAQVLNLPAFQPKKNSEAKGDPAVLREIAQFFPAVNSVELTDETGS